MIKIQIFRGFEGRISGYAVTGHSGTAARGEDIVCAGVPVLAETALLGIGKQLHRQVDYRVASGDLYVSLKELPDEHSDVLLETMLLGMREIEKAYPKAVRISEVRR